MVIVVLGLVFYVCNIKNFFIWEECVVMIVGVMLLGQCECLCFVVICDYYDDCCWFVEVCCLVVVEIDFQVRVLLVGYFKDVFSYYLCYFL